MEKSVLPKRDWVEMTWEDFAGADRTRWIAVLPVAAVEQHGPHLPVGTDAHIAAAYLSRARELLPSELPVSFLPMLPIGTSEEHRAFPGTLTLAADTLIRVLTEIAESVHRAGLRKLVIANSHGGNVSAVDLVTRDLRVRLNMLAVACSWFGFGYPDGQFPRSRPRSCLPRTPGWCGPGACKPSHRRESSWRASSVIWASTGPADSAG